MKAALYARVSLEEQTEQFGLPSQLRAMKEFAEQNRYVTSDDLTFIDGGYLGGNLDRPALEKLRALIRLRRIDVVIAHDPDRLSRKLSHQLILRDECERSNVRLEFVTTPAADNAEGRMFLNMKGVFAEFEREKIKERTLRGRREKARQGFIVGGRPPFGYRYLGKAEGDRGRLAIDDREAPIVREVFSWAAQGASIREIATRLNDLGHKPKYSSRWGKSSVFRLLSNETYVGRSYYNRRRREQPDDVPEEHRFRRNKKTLIKMRPESEWIRLNVPPIIERDVFDRVHEHLRQNLERRSGRPSTRYLLRGLCRCGHCQRRLQGCPSHGMRYYRCSGKDRLAIQRCASGLVHADKLESSVWRAITETLGDVRKLRPLIERHFEQFRDAGENEKREAELRQQLENLRRREFRARESMLDAALADHYENFKRSLKEACSRRSSLEAELQAITRGRGAVPETFANLDQVCRSIRRELANANDAVKAGFLQRVVKQITVMDKHASIVCIVPQRAYDRAARLGQDHAR